jgi:hypothetical protein
MKYDSKKIERMIADLERTVKWLQMVVKSNKKQGA